MNLVAGPALDDVALKAELAGVAERSILHFDNLEPHSFAGFRSDKARSSTAVLQLGPQMWPCQPAQRPSDCIASYTQNRTHRTRVDSVLLILGNTNTREACQTCVATLQATASAAGLKTFNATEECSWNDRKPVVYRIMWTLKGSIVP